MMRNLEIVRKLSGMPRSDVPEGYNDFVGLHELAGEQYLRKSLIGNMEGMFLAADARALLGVASLKKDLGIQVQHLAKAHVQINGENIIISQPCGRGLYAYISIGLNSNAAEEREHESIGHMHKIADFFRRYFSDKRIVEKEPQWIPTMHLDALAAAGEREEIR